MGGNGNFYPSAKRAFIYDWFVKYKAEDMKTTMIASIRSNAGLGSPPGRYTTNRNESINNAIQASSNYAKSTWVDLNNKLYQLVIDQQKEVERSIFGMGEYKFKANYRHLEIDSSRWFLMTAEQRKKHIKRVFTIQSISFESIDEQIPSSALTSESSSGSSSGTSASGVHLSVKVEKSGITSIPAELLNCMWKKAERLLSTPKMHQEWMMLNVWPVIVEESLTLFLETSIMKSFVMTHVLDGSLRRYVHMF